ncbi:uncharacterized protein N7479_007013 [Penicillium vulpinum]|uniref:DUF7730 domain-containing protein n=1 Tax=Penicillium vulpinum TaxID=29845 RepID=A0A1V6S2E9_9EURO|nr:uncharacterized protein N7479_007013 [Penicillium vulpinum]KAJ5959863.1 hypothetical protein N7479_007013 [Penicillium vulpinum]OQE08221.1 hypothetical protein PENVUL_c010G01064 [Penicillium vulpinum]
MARMKQGVFSWEDVLVQRYQSNKPPPLPRHQTIPFSAPQLQSRLLTRLSPELRLMIWGFVFADQRIHIIQCSKQRLGHVVCPCALEPRSSPPKRHTRQNSNLFCEICHGTGISQPAKDADLLRWNKVKLLGLALTCRQIYHESISLLYTLPTLEFSNPWTLPYLLPTIPPEHRDRIRSIELRWSFPGHWLPSKDSVRAVYVSAGRTPWTETCRAVSQLASLRSFVLMLESNWFSEPAEKLAGFLEPLRGLVVRSVSRRSWDWKFGRDEVGSPLELEVDGNWKANAHANGKEKSGGRIRVSDVGFGDGFSSDEDSCKSLGSDSGSFSSGGCDSTAGSTGARGSWELRLQGQSYYLHELDRVGVDLRRRGIDCWISAV